MLIRAQFKATPEQSDRQIAQEPGVSHVTVGTVRSELEAGGQIDQCSRQASDGRTFHKPVVSVFNPTKREERAVSNPEVVSHMQEAGTDAITADILRLRVKLSPSCQVSTACTPLLQIKLSPSCQSSQGVGTLYPLLTGSPANAAGAGGTAVSGSEDSGRSKAR